MPYLLINEGKTLWTLLLFIIYIFSNILRCFFISKHHLIPEVLKQSVCIHDCKNHKHIKGFEEALTTP